MFFNLEDLIIKKVKGLPIGQVIDFPKDYCLYYQFDKEGILREKKISKKKMMNELTIFINGKSYLFKKPKKIKVSLKEISKLIQ